MGIVYEAIHAELLRRVALKILPKDCSGAGAAAEAFRREARTLARLSHPNLVTVHEFGRSTDGRLYCAMELVKGETLEQRVRRIGALDWEEVVAIGVDACRGLEAAHGAGVLHRDLTPSNLLVCEQEGAAVGRDRRALVKLVDFGIADIRVEATVAGKAPGAHSDERGLASPRPDAGHEADDESGSDLADALASDDSERGQVPRSGPPALERGAPRKAALQARSARAAASRECVRIVGTPEYMAPEQARGDQVDARADLYALATVLYEACTGRLPYEATSLVGLIESKLVGPCPPMRPPGMHRPVPRALQRVIAKGLAPDPADRHSSATVMREALEAVWLSRRQLPGGARARVRTAGMALCLGAAAVLVGAGALGVWSLTPAGERATSSVGLRHASGPASWIRRVLHPDGVVAADARDGRSQPAAPSALTTLASSGSARQASAQPTNVQPTGPSWPPGSPAAAFAPAPLPTTPAAAEPPASAAPRPASSEPLRGRDRLPRSARPRYAATRVAAPPMPHVNGAPAVPASDLSPYPAALSEAITKLADGEFGRALELFRVLATAYPSDLSALRGWAEAAMASREWPEAQKAAERWQLVDSGTEPRLYVARIQLLAGRNADAVVTLRALLESHPECDEARGLLRDQGAEFPGAGEGSRAASDRGHTSGLH